MLVKYVCLLRVQHVNQNAWRRVCFHVVWRNNTKEWLVNSSRVSGEQPKRFDKAEAMNFKGKIAWLPPLFSVSLSLVLVECGVRIGYFRWCCSMPRMVYRPSMLRLATNATIGDGNCQLTEVWPVHRSTRWTKVRSVSSTMRIDFAVELHSKMEGRWLTIAREWQSIETR